MNSQEISHEIRIVIDNKCALDDFLMDFGFSALIFNHFTQHYLLFDTGSNGNLLLHNISRCNVQIKDIKKVVISHDHFDHTGGLSTILNHNPEIEVYVPQDNLPRFKRAFPTIQIHGVSKKIEIEEGVFSSGQLGTYISEECLFLKTLEDGMVLIVGCTHPGLENFIVKARETNTIKAVIGGFHGFNKYSYLEGIDFIGACHCTARINEIRERFPDQFKKICVGSSFSF